MIRRRELLGQGFDVVTTADLPLVRKESAYFPLVRQVDELPRRVGVRLRVKFGNYTEARALASLIRQTAIKLGKPVTNQVRRVGEHYIIWVFKRRDFVAIRKGDGARL